MKRIHTFDEFRAAAARFRNLMRQLSGERGAREGLPANDLTLGLLVVAREETPTTGNPAEDVADMRCTARQLTNAAQLLHEADTWLVAESVRLRSDTDKSLSKRLETAAGWQATNSPTTPRCMGGLG